MKIVYLLRDYVDPAGMERVIAKKANYLVERGYTVYIVSLFESNKEPFFHFDSRIIFHCLNLVGDESIRQNFVKELSSYFAIIKPDIAISTGINAMKYLYEVKDASKKILELHFSKYRRKHKITQLDSFFLGRIITSIYSYKQTSLAKKYDAFVVLTNEDRQDWRGLENIVTIPNPLPFIPSVYSDLKTKRIIAIGRYTGQKGFDFLIDIWNNVAPNFPDWKLSLYGVGPKRGKLEMQTKKLGLSDRIEFNLPTKNVEEELNKSAIYAMTSRYEGMPLVLLEAMACGLPAVSFACKSGPRDIIKDGEDGFLIKMGDKAAFAEKLSLLMSDYELRAKIGEKARENILRFSEDKIMPLWENLFEKLVNAK